MLHDLPPSPLPSLLNEIYQTKKGHYEKKHNTFLVYKRQEKYKIYQCTYISYKMAFSVLSWFKFKEAQ